MYIKSDFPALSRMTHVTLADLKSVSLMNRIDTKFVTNISRLGKILDDACSYGYKVCEIAGQQLLRYTSIYYDTGTLDMFRAHRNGKKTRQKIRVRTYHINGCTYLEIKNKQNTGRTKKKRIEIPENTALQISSDTEAVKFIEKYSIFNIYDIAPETSTDFFRITLTDKDLTERVTIDINLSFINHRNGMTSSLSDLVIIEIKQDGKNLSTMKDILLQNRVFPLRISKYCLSVILTEQDIHPGRYNEKLRHLYKITTQK